MSPKIGFLCSTPFWIVKLLIWEVQGIKKIDKSVPYSLTPHLAWCGYTRVGSYLRFFFSLCLISNFSPTRVWGWWWSLGRKQSPWTDPGSILVPFHVLGRFSEFPDNGSQSFLACGHGRMPRRRPRSYILKPVSVPLLRVPSQPSCHLGDVSLLLPSIFTVFSLVKRSNVWMLETSAMWNLKMSGEDFLSWLSGVLLQPVELSDLVSPHGSEGSREGKGAPWLRTQWQVICLSWVTALRCSQLSRPVTQESGSCYLEETSQHFSPVASFPVWRSHLSCCSLSFSVTVSPVAGAPWLSHGGGTHPVSVLLTALMLWMEPISVMGMRAHSSVVGCLLSDFIHQPISCTFKGNSEGTHNMKGKLFIFHVFSHMLSVVLNACLFCGSVTVSLCFFLLLFY